jgi:hypothetical protein
MPESHRKSGSSSPPLRPSFLAGEPTRSSYVYPVRSLLSGRIQPATDQFSAQINRSNSSGNVVDLNLTPREPRIFSPIRAPSEIPYWTKDHTDAGMRSAELWEEIEPSSNEGGTDSPSNSTEKFAPSSVSRPRRRMKSDSQSALDRSMISPTQRHKRRERSASKNSPNFRHFPAEDDRDSYNTRSFSSRTAGSMSISSSPPLASMETIAIGPSPVGEMISASNSFTATSNSGPEWSQPRLSTSPQSSPPPLQTPAAAALPFNPSEYGIVHLPPVPLTPTPELAEQGDLDPHTPSLESSKSSQSRPASSEATDQQYLTTHPSIPSESPHNIASSIRSGSGSGSTSDSLGSGTAVSTEPLISFRYEHAQDENGNHVVIGREGELQRCEDEVSRPNVSCY